MILREAVTLYTCWFDEKNNHEGIGAEVVSHEETSSRMDMAEKARPFVTDIGKDCWISMEYSTVYRSMAPTGLYIAHDRLDEQQVVVYLMKRTTTPNQLLLQRHTSDVEQRPLFELFYVLQRVPEMTIDEAKTVWVFKPIWRSADRRRS